MYCLCVTILLLLFANFTQQSQEEFWQKWKKKKGTAPEGSQRILELMRSYYEEANVRIANMNYIRFMYEESPYYEVGYLMGEIIERYRKMVEHIHRPIQYKSHTVHDTLMRLELVQRLYIEIYHLIRMIHETPRKWKNEVEFFNVPGIDGWRKEKQKKDQAEHKDGADHLIAAQERLREQRENQMREMKRRRKVMAKLRKKWLLIGAFPGQRTPVRTGPPNRHWPIEYGWEIYPDW